MMGIEENGKVVGIVGSPNKDGLTFRHVNKALEGVKKAGIETELVQMSDYLIDTCHDCLPWVCRENLRCTYNDENFEKVAEKILNCKGLIMGTPVYWTLPSAQIHLLMIKMVRVYLTQFYSPTGSEHSRPALGIAVAGGSGRGMLSGLRPIYIFLRFLQFKAIEPLPVTQFKLDETERIAEESGLKIGEMIKNPQPFSNRNERATWYDNLPYLGEPLRVETRLLASIIMDSIPDEKKKEIKGNAEQADILAAAGKTLDSIAEINNICDSGMQIFTNL
jgi:multimeric flavodoxin WrbA